MLRETVENLKYMTREERIDIVKDPEFRKKIFEERNHYPFVWCVQDLQGDEILSFLDDEALGYLEKDKKLRDKLNAIITSNNPYVNIFLSSDKAISLIVKEINMLRSFLSALDVNFGKKFVNYLLDNNIDITYLGYLSGSVQLEVLKDKSIYDKIKSKSPSKGFLSCLDVDTISYLLKDKYYENILINCDVSGLNYLFERGLSLPVYLQENNEIIDKFVVVENVNLSHAYIERLSKNNPYLKEHIMTKRKNIYINEVSNIDSGYQIFSKYKDCLDKKIKLSNNDDPRLFRIISIYEKKEDCLRNLQRLTETVMLEMIIDILFEDITYNVLKNINIILEYTEKFKSKLVSEDNLSIYDKLSNFYKLSFEDKVSFFNMMMEKDNMIEDFYDDFRNILNHCYNGINSSLLELRNNNEVDTIDNIPIYKLEGEPFYMLVHSTGKYRDGNPQSVWHDRGKTVSLSLIGDTHLGTYGNPNEEIILGFSNIDIDKIMHVYKADSYTAREHGTNRVPSIMSPEELLNNTVNFNELLIKEDDKLQPSYIVCYDEVKSGDIEASKSLGNIPIIVIDTKKYNTNYEISDYEDERYKSINESYYPISYKKGR